MTSRERVLAMIEGRPVDRLPLMPITMMFATDLIGRPYRDYVTDHRVMVEAQLAVAEAFGFDFVSTISDPTREVCDLGAPVTFFDDLPPAVQEDNALLKDKTHLAALRVPDPTAGGRMLDRVQALALFRERVGGRLLIEGWIEGPCAEGADLRGLNTLMFDFFDDPAFVRDLFEFAIEMELAFARAQIEAGADLIGLGDAAASLVGPQIYEEFIWPYEKRLVDGVHAMGGRVRLHICGNTRKILDGMGRLGCEIVDLDFLVPVAEGRQAMGPDQTILGNIDPVHVLREGTPDGIRQALAQCHREAGPRYIVAAGCEVVRDTPKANILAMRDYAFGADVNQA
ncbi:MAG TPA: uroporphyrinogen decarboxylase family protein [Phycisphaerae bacterium]|nr:uroporphyrinogen decarboxylase family protein [Phycisphaerae bacterium]